MKNLISYKGLLAILLVTQIIMQVRGQEYHKLIEGPDKYWDIAHIDPIDICGYAGIPNRYFVNSDTLINSILYSKVYAYPFISLYAGSYCPPYVVDTNFYLTDIYIREDTVLKKVYRYYAQEDSVVLLFDFSINIHDTLRNYPSDQGIATIDTIYEQTFNDNIVRKTFVLRTNYDDYGEYTEGTGGLNGPFEFPWYNLDHYNLLCLTLNNEKIINGECYSFLTDIEANRLNNVISIFPNPANTEVTISFGDNTYRIIELCSTMGMTISKYKCFEDNIKIDLSEISPGCNIVKVYDKNNTLFTKKLIKL